MKTYGTNENKYKETFKIQIITTIVILGVCFMFIYGAYSVYN